MISLLVLWILQQYTKTTFYFTLVASPVGYQEEIVRLFGARQERGSPPQRSVGTCCIVQRKCHDMGL